MADGGGAAARGGPQLSGSACQPNLELQGLVEEARGIQILDARQSARFTALLKLYDDNKSVLNGGPGRQMVSAEI